MYSLGPQRPGNSLQVGIFPRKLSENIAYPFHPCLRTYNIQSHLEKVSRGGGELRVKGAEPLSGDQGAKRSEADTFLLLKS